jgi:hypothetical protein
MGVRLSELKAKTRTVVVEYDDNKIEMAYRPHVYTMDLADAVDAAEDSQVVATLLSPIVEWWDVLDDHDQRIPPTVENMRQFPLPLLNAVMDAVNADARPEQEG